ncbi:unnamed protein product [Brachionus calyciflorus]|uniref:Uncharacterized protein n=1 Tax=Brachionus calyciflorus TaxID=104777 RepID=A0A813YX67_9BILA|nr:unnamed protein product [Brachionus calyciflorus]
MLEVTKNSLEDQLSKESTPDGINQARETIGSQTTTPIELIVHPPETDKEINEGTFWIDTDHLALQTSPTPSPEVTTRPVQPSTASTPLVPTPLIQSSQASTPPIQPTPVVVQPTQSPSPANYQRLPSGIRQR